MAFENLTENFKSSLNQFMGQIQETSIYQNLSDRYQNLNSPQQKLVKLLSLLISILFVLYFPISNILETLDISSQFEDQRQLTKTLIKSHRDVIQMPDLPQPLSSDNTKSMIEAQLKELNLLPEQINQVAITAGSSRLIPQNKIQYGLNVFVNKLNLKQITNLGSKLQAIHPAIKLKDLTLSSNLEDGRYMDAQFKLIALNIPKYTPPPPEPDSKKNSKSNNKNKSKNEDE